VLCKISNFPALAPLLCPNYNLQYNNNSVHSIISRLMWLNFESHVVKFHITPLPTTCSASRMIVLTQTTPYPRKHQRTCNFNSSTLVVEVLTVSIALPSFSFEFNSRLLTSTSTNIVTSIGKNWCPRAT